MTTKIIELRSKNEKLAYGVGRQSGLRTSYDAVEQLTEQLIAARAELQEARAEYAMRIAATKDYFDRECAACRKELTEALEQLHQLRSTMFMRCIKTETDAVN